MQYGLDSDWQLGTCGNVGTKHGNYIRVIQRCCLRPGPYVLTCINKKKPYGWGEGYIEIQGHRYCNDFMSYRIMQKITIKSMNIESF